METHTQRSPRPSLHFSKRISLLPNKGRGKTCYVSHSLLASRGSSSPTSIVVVVSPLPSGPLLTDSPSAETPPPHYYDRVQYLPSSSHPFFLHDCTVVVALGLSFPPSLPSLSLSLSMCVGSFKLFPLPCGRRRFDNVSNCTHLPK